MQQLRECIHRLRLNHSLRKISRELKVYRPVLRKIKALADKKGWLDPNNTMPDDQEIHNAWKPNPQAQTTKNFDPYLEEIKQWRSQGYSAVVIHRLLSDKVSCSIWQVRRYLNQVLPKTPEPVMIRPTYPGEIVDVDFGFIGMFWDPQRNKLRKTWVFSARLRHSRKAYRQVVFDQTFTTFILCHIHAFEWFGGVMAKIVLDNLKAGVIKSCIDNDQLNRAYREMAEYYGIILDPCLPARPEHKGGVESDIHYIKVNFLPLIKERQKYQPHLGLDTLQQLLEKWDKEVADIRIVYGVGKSPIEIFENEERATLRPLPSCRWDIVEWSQYQVRRDWRIMYDYAYYSVPYWLIGQTVEVRATSTHVYIFFEYNQIAVHQRAKQKWEYLRNANHAPPFKEAVLACTREGLLSQAEEIGPHVRELAQKILADPVVDKLRPVRCLLTLAISYSKERLDRACERALYYNILRYRSVKNILENGLDQEPFEEKKPKVCPLFKHARDPGEYKIQSANEEVLRG